MEGGEEGAREREGGGGENIDEWLINSFRYNDKRVGVGERKITILNKENKIRSNIKERKGRKEQKTGSDTTEHSTFKP